MSERNITGKKKPKHLEKTS